VTPRVRKTRISAESELGSGDDLELGEMFKIGISAFASESRDLALAREVVDHLAGAPEYIRVTAFQSLLYLSSRFVEIIVDGEPALTNSALIDAMLEQIQLDLFSNRDGDA